ncbi:hypothetical protein V2I01_17005 [Micromonospora sp. BRA006-A]|nr:hypothetical protein [Micromonospora sp. BRA006-A]
MLDVLGPRGRLLMRSHYFHDRERHPRGPAAGGVLDVSAYERVEDLTWRRTCWSPTIPRRCSTTRCWTGR